MSNNFIPKPPPPPPLPHSNKSNFMNNSGSIESNGSLKKTYRPPVYKNKPSAMKSLSLNEQSIHQFCSTVNITPYRPEQQNNFRNGDVTDCNVTSSHAHMQKNTFHPKLKKSDTLPTKENSMLVGSINGLSVGEGPCTLYSAVNGGYSTSAEPGGNGATLKEPQIRKLAYNMYRGLLNTKHERANNIVEAAPTDNITKDEGIADRVTSMM